MTKRGRRDTRRKTESVKSHFRQTTPGGKRKRIPSYKRRPG